MVHERRAGDRAPAPGQIRYSRTLTEKVLRSWLSLAIAYSSASCEDIEKEIEQGTCKDCLFYQKKKGD
jgi:hypothetical protein